MERPYNTRIGDWKISGAAKYTGRYVRAREIKLLFCILFKYSAFVPVRRKKREERAWFFLMAIALPCSLSLTE